MILQTLVSRETSPLDSVVVSITKLAAGEGANNVIPDVATFGGTLRCLSKERMLATKQRIEEVTSLPPGFTQLVLCFLLGGCLVARACMLANLERS